jgi:hypothetical protein
LTCSNYPVNCQGLNGSIDSFYSVTRYENEAV